MGEVGNSPNCELWVGSWCAQRFFITFSFKQKEENRRAGAWMYIFKKPQSSWFLFSRKSVFKKLKTSLWYIIPFAQTGSALFVLWFSHLRKIMSFISLTRREEESSVFKRQSWEVFKDDKVEWLHAAMKISVGQTSKQDFFLSKINKFESTSYKLLAQFYGRLYCG